MLITLNRFKWTDTSTLGQLYFDGRNTFWSEKYGRDMFVFTLEDTDRELYDTMTWVEIEKKKIAKTTAIPYGKYPLVINYSPRFKKEMPLVKNVKAFTGIRIHNGSFIVDTDACVLVGYEQHLLVDKNQYMVSKSKDCFSELLPMLQFALKREEVWIEITK